MTNDKTTKHTGRGHPRCRAHPTPTPRYRPRSAPARTARRRCRVSANRTNTAAAPPTAVPAGVEWLTPNQAAQHIQIPARQLQQWRYLTKGPPYSLAGRAVRYRRTDLDTWLTARRVEPSHT